jgi:chemosensory pili system protein ChpA (sensor histidine kinase/response regulator)
MVAFKCVVIEDDKSFQNIYRIVLQRVGFDVTFISDGQLAIEILQETTPDLIILDLRLPLINGFDVYDYIQSADHLKDSLVVVVTSLDRADKSSRDMHDIEFYQKPISPSKIAQIAEKKRDLLMERIT